MRVVMPAGAAEVVLFYGAALLPEQENDQLLLGSRAALELFAENYRPRGDLCRWTIIERAEAAQRTCDLRL